ncbi:MAG TPA: MlaD family protein [Oscillatoriaceae cyanobacterium]
MALSPASKVAMVTVGGVVVLVAGLAWLTNFSFLHRGYEIEVVYTDVAGLMKGADVMLMGVRVGKVAEISPMERKVIVTAHITDQGTHLLRGSRFWIMSQGLVGEKSLEIFPPTDASTTATIAPGATVYGENPKRLEFVMADLTKTFEDFRKSTDPAKLNRIFTQTAQNLLDTTTTIRQLGHQAGGSLDRINTLLDDADRLVGSAKPEEVAATVRDLHELSAGLLDTYQQMFGTAKSRHANAETLKRLGSLARQLDELATTLNQTAGSPDVQHDIRQVLHNIRALTGGVSQATQIAQPATFNGIKLSPRLDAVAAHTPTGTGLAGNLGLHLNLGSNYGELGLEQIGEGNYLNLGFGSDRAWGPLGYEFGLIRSKIGVGIDYDLTRDLQLTGQLYDPFQPTFRLGTSYFPLAGGQYGLMAQWARPFATNDNYFWLGVEWRPLQ